VLECIRGAAQALPWYAIGWNPMRNFHARRRLAAPSVPLSPSVCISEASRWWRYGRSILGY
jgi:hypothetical protein